MTRSQKVALLKTLSSNRVLRAEVFYDILKECGDLKFNYYDYASTHPIDCRQELMRLPAADYDTCCALLTMLLREDHFSNGSFDERQRNGEVKPIVDRMISLLEEETERGNTMKKILLDDILRIPADQVSDVKVQFNQHNSSEDPMELYLHDPEIVNTQWLF